MNVLVVEDNSIRREELTRLVKCATPSAKITACSSDEEVLRMHCERYDVALLDVALPCASGIDLACHLQRTNPRVNLLFTTSFSECIADALRMHCSGYLLTPVTLESLLLEFESLRWSPDAATSSGHGNIHMRCFGSFEVFCDGALALLIYKKSQRRISGS